MFLNCRKRVHIDRIVRCVLAVCLVVAVAGCLGFGSNSAPAEPTPGATAVTPTPDPSSSPGTTPTQSPDTPDATPASSGNQTPTATPEESAGSVLDSLSADSLDSISVSFSQLTMAQEYNFQGSVSPTENQLTGIATFHNDSGEQSVTVRESLSPGWTQQVVGNFTDDRSATTPANLTAVAVSDFWRETTVRLEFETATVEITTNESTKLIRNGNLISVFVVTVTSEDQRLQYYSTDAELRISLLRLWTAIDDYRPTAIPQHAG